MLYYLPFLLSYILINTPIIILLSSFKGNLSSKSFISTKLQLVILLNTTISDESIIFNIISIYFIINMHDKIN